MSAADAPRPVLLTEDAVRDLDEVVRFISERESPARAACVLDRMEEALASLARFPERGTRPKELLAVGVEAYREIRFKPYRIIYRALPDAVYVLLVSDGRRDAESLLQRRLLGDTPL